MLTRMIFFVVMTSSFLYSADYEARYQAAEDVFDSYNGNSVVAKENSSKSTVSSVKTESIVSAKAPTVLVMPAQSVKGMSELEVIQKNPYARKTMEAINEGLSNKKYELLSLEGQKDLDNFILTQNAIAGKDEDLAYLASLFIGADVYVKYAGEFSAKNIKLELSAYETTTGRLIGTEMSSSKMENLQELDGKIKSEADKCIDKLDVKIKKYWSDELRNGSRYRVVFNLTGDFEEDFVEELQDKISVSLQNIFGQVSVNVMTGKTIDVIVFAKQTSFANAQAVYSAIRSELKPIVGVKKINLTKSLILVELK